MDWLNTLVASPWFNAISLIVGVALATLFFRLAKRDKEPCYAIAGQQVLQKYNDKVTIHYHNTADEIETLSVAYVAFWNNGAGTIEKSCIVKHDPITIKVPNGVKIVDMYMLAVSRDIIKFDGTVSRERNSATLTFDFLDKYDGAIACLLHNGPRYTHITLCGTIKGTRGLRRIYHGRSALQPLLSEPDYEITRSPWFSQPLPMLVYAFAFLFLAIVSYFHGADPRHELTKLLNHNPPEVKVAVGRVIAFDTLTGVFLLMAVLSVLRSFFVRNPRRLPRSLREFDSLFWE